MIKYNATKDPDFQKPYIDRDEWVDSGWKYRYVHGGFEGTELKFAFFFPESQAYKGRFFHFMSPVQGSENASIGRKGIEDKIGFAVSNGAYFVETNMGVAVPFAPITDPTIIYRASAAAAEYSRVLAKEMYGDHHPYGYIYGGSGGGFKSTSCFENTNTWDGAVPYVIGSPVAIPNCFTVRAHARRVLRNKISDIMDSIEPGGKPLTGLNSEEQEAWDEICKMGFPIRAWFLGDTMDDGALPVLTPHIYQADPTYFKDFWELPGYLGADPNSSANRDRIVHKTTVTGVVIPTLDVDINSDAMTGVDEAWQKEKGTARVLSKPQIIIDESLDNPDLYLYGTKLEFLTGDAAGYTVPLESIDGNTVTVGEGFGQADMLEKLSLVRPGDQILLNNSDYIAIQTYHRHQLPDEGYEGFKQFRNKDGSPLYPQRSLLLGPQVAAGGAGSIQTGKFDGKMIVVVAAIDESAFPWQADWYKTQVKKQLGDNFDENFRLWFFDNALHDDAGKNCDELRTCGYLGSLHQALLDLSDWVERDIVPAQNTKYEISDGQLYLSNTSSNRGGIQPLITLKVDDSDHVTIKAGDTVHFEADIIIPEGSGKITKLEWSFEGDQDYPFSSEYEYASNSLNGVISASAKHKYTYAKPGTYFPAVRVNVQRNSNKNDIFTQVRNVSRVRITAI